MELISIKANPGRLHSTMMLDVVRLNPNLRFMTWSMVTWFLVDLTMKV